MTDTGKKIALLLSVSSYQNEDNLPPCKKDIELMSSIILGAKKYDDVLILKDSPKSNEAKDKISAFIRKNQGQNIDEVLVYYTGHGTRNTDDFLYLFSDFDSSKMEQTSLRNSEFDAMLKSLNPELTVKIVDACQSGTEYIKSNQDLEIVFKKSSEESFNKTYFLFSSSNTESSVALQDYSVFTKSFARSLMKFKGQDIRYRDVMAFISDDKNVKKHQTPLFIQQADNTEIFCGVSPDLAEVLDATLSKIDVDSKDDGVVPDENYSHEAVLTHEDILIQAIKEKSNAFCSEEEAQKSLSYLIKILTEYEWPQFITTLFSIDLTEQSHTVTLDSKKSLAKWMKDSEEPYFISLTYSEEEYQAKEKVVYEDSQLAMISPLFGSTKRTEYQPVTRYRDVISGYELTAPAPSQTIMFSFSPTEQALPWLKVFFTYVFSKSKLTLFYKHEVERETSWSNRELEDKNEWKTRHCSLKSTSAIDNMIQDSMEDIVQSVTQEVSADL